MTQPRQVWTIFGVSAAIVVGALVWASGNLLSLDRAQREAQRQAAREEIIRQVLWHMDTALAAILAQENVRPHQAYDGPLNSPHALLYFQIQDGQVIPAEAPAAPSQPDRPPADEAAFFLTLNQRVATVQKLIDGRHDTLIDELAPPAPPEEFPANALVSANQTNALSNHQLNPTLRSENDFQNRALGFNGIVNQGQVVLPRSDNVLYGPMTPLCYDDQLLLLRQVRIGPELRVQGLWLDWPEIRRSLLDANQELLPHADLEPLSGKDSSHPARTLALLPMALLPGPIDLPVASGVSPLRVSLAVAWVAVGIALLAVGVLLGGVVALSERRAAFVSAVTHELRTPLTTFTLYTDLLTGGKVQDEDKRRRYLQTLKGEAERLIHLVTNVLVYSRLERGSPVARQQPQPVDRLLERVVPRLTDLARHGRMELETRVGPGAAETLIAADASVVEQILTNLVDNACKYANGAADRTVHLDVERRQNELEIRVRDHGPGIDPQQRRGLFRPFSKSAHDAANSAPGVGLGLSLSRRLARQLRGDLKLDDHTTEGACFVLRLPAHRQA